MRPILSDLRLIDQRNTMKPAYSDVYSAALESLPPAANVTGTRVFSSEDGGTPLVGLYFGANWCPPCRSFSPQLNQFAKDNASKFSVVFVSADHTEDDAQKFAESKSFLIVPYRDAARQKLLQHFKINSFPTLVVLDTRNHECKVVTRWGRLAVQSESSPGALVNRWLASQGGLFPKQYLYYFVVLVVVVFVVSFYKF